MGQGAPGGAVAEELSRREAQTGLSGSLGWVVIGCHGERVPQPSGIDPTNLQVENNTEE